MPRLHLTHTAPLLCAAALVAGCGGERVKEEDLEVANQVAEGPEVPPLEAPPPMIARSAAYRCDDGNALYVDILTDGGSVNVRDSRSDIPKLLKRGSEGAPFTGEDRTLSGTGDQVNYSSPDRPNQSCRVAAA